MKKISCVIVGLVFLLGSLLPVWADKGTGWYFEDFSAAPASGWTHSKTGGTSEISGGALQIGRTESSGAVDATMTLGEPVASGSVSIAFTLTMTGTDKKKLLIRPRNSANQNVAVFEMRQNEGIFPRLPQATAAYKQAGSDKLVNGVPVRVRLLFDLGTEGGRMFVFLNGQPVQIKTDPVSEFLAFQPSAAGTMDIAGLNLNISTDQAGGAAVLDDLHVYQTDSDAEKAAQAYDSLTLAIDMDNVTEDLALPARDDQTGSTITWKSSKPAVIGDDGKVTRPTAGDEAVTMTASIESPGHAVVTKDFTVKVTAPAASFTGPDWHFEHFDDTRPEGWSMSGGGGTSAVNEAAGCLEIARAASGSTASASFTLPQGLQAGSGRLAIEFNFICDGENGEQKELQFSGRTGEPGATKNAFVYFLKQGDQVTIRNDKGQGSSSQVDSRQKLPRGRKTHLKTVLDFDASETDGAKTYKGCVSTYINGVLSPVTKTFFDQSDNGPLKSLYFNITSDQAGARVLIDDFKVYRVYPTASDAQQLAEAAFSLPFPADCANVAADVTLPDSAVWKSSDSAVISDSGAVTRPAAGEPDGTAVMTAVLTRGLVRDKKDFACTVPAAGDSCVYLPHQPLTNQDGLTVDVARPGDTVRGFVRVNNDSGEPESGVILMALYDETGRLETVKEKSYTAPANTAGYAESAEMIIPDEGNYTVRRYVLAGADSVRPILPAAGTNLR